MIRPLVSLLLLLLLASRSSLAFVPAASFNNKAQQASTTTTTRLASTAAERSNRNKPKKKNKFTFKDLREEIQQKPTKFLADDQRSNKKKKPRYRRSRRRVDNPQQQYVYAQQRQEDGAAQEAVPIALAREYGLTNPSAQHCDALVDEVEPEILGQIRVGEEAKSGSYAYVINKPAGWSILGGAPSNANVKDNNKAKEASEEDTANNHKDDDEGSNNSKPKPKQHQVTRLEITDLDGSKEVLEYSEADLLAVMTPEEIEEYKAEMEEESASSSKPTKTTKRVKVRADDDEEDEDDMLTLDELEREELELLRELTPEELELYLQEGGELPENFKLPSDGGAVDFSTAEENVDLEEEFSMEEKRSEKDQSTTTPKAETTTKPLDPKTEEVYTKIEARQTSAKTVKKASFSSASSRPSVVAWLKEKKAQEGAPMKGGKYWTALAGATDVDDSGIVLICPKQHTENVFVDYLEYTAVVGNHKHLASKTTKGVTPTAPEELSMDIVSTVRRGRGEDSVQTVKVMVPEKFSSCSSIVPACQEQFQDGIRGDPAGNPFQRLAHRRLLHCNAVSVSSLLFAESVEAETEEIPDDIAILAERRNQHGFKEGSFLGRAALSNNPLTTAYREINGAADGFPGWTVDRYDQWLLVQHDDTMPRGPLPSIHDGNTAGVYYLPANPDRSAMGSASPAPGSNGPTRPRLLEGQPAPDTVSILENGITYHVNLDKDLSTGIFLDQRSQRAWLSRNCNEDTHVLNCFAHCGAFSVAAATAGASTTSLDLNKKWLDRVAPQMEANGVEFDVRHDCIYGDCFDWLAKLAKRQEKYDIVILDPPSSSVGGKKKKRWSIKNDMPELVSLASKVVKKGGLLWTTTNSASVTPVKFARLCRRGLEDAGLGSAKLERIQPMPHDFPSIGPQPVKNFVWRLP